MSSASGFRSGIQRARQGAKLLTTSDGRARGSEDTEPPFPRPFFFKTSHGALFASSIFVARVAVFFVMDLGEPAS